MEKTIPELQAAMAAGTITSRTLVEQYLARIAAYDQNGPRVNAMIVLNPKAVAEAEALDRERSTRGPRGPLHGIPVVVKDNFDTRDLPTSAGSAALASLQPASDAFQVRKLREAGAIILGKTNLHELACGITSISSLGGQTRNPYDPLRYPGGSSGGTGAAVAANFAVAGLGSDTCGSIRIPCAYNNLVGLRPSRGLSSRAGIIPLSESQDVAGPLARTVTDLAILLDATVGPDDADPVTKLGDSLRPKSFRDELKQDALKGARIGVLKELFGAERDDEEAGSIVRKALAEMKGQGSDIVDISMPELPKLLEGTSVIDFEFKSDLQSYLEREPNPPVHGLAEIVENGLYHADLESVFKRRLAADTRDSERYKKALAQRTVVRDAVLALLAKEKLDALAYPTMTRRPARIGEAQRGSTCQLSASTGLPAISIPAGFTDDGLPIGVELLGTPFADAKLVGLAFSFEQAAHHRRAPWSTPALFAGKAPGPGHLELTLNDAASKGAGRTVRVRFSFDPLRGELVYDLRISGFPAEEILGAAIHRGAAGANGPLIGRLLDRHALSGSGLIQLMAADREALNKGALYLSVLTRSHPTTGLRAQLAPIPPR
jgi:Asp-tRNA(Asn)/Glu-tRNA(Gln) amidotransferase A subunit family amidase